MEPDRHRAGAGQAGRQVDNSEERMAWLKRKPDPISDRARKLNSEIATLEEQIRRLDSQLQRGKSHPKLRSTAVPHGATITHSTQASQPVTTTVRPGPIFEEVNQDRLTARNEAGAATPEHYNELRVRKYDLPGFLSRVREAFRGPTTTNPKLVSYLAAGGVQGLRPLRKEKRIARNRFIMFTLFLFLMLLGIIYVFVRGR
jgi:hypothetical protein